MEQSVDMEYHGWPSRKPVWGIGALFLAMAIAVGVFYGQQNYEWTFLQRYYLSMYLKTWVRSDLFPKSSGRYALIDAVNAHAMERMAVGNEAEQVTDADGTPAYVVTDQARRNGVVRLSWNGGEFNNQKLHAYLQHWIYLDKTAWDLVRTAVWWGCGAFVLGLFVAIPRDRKRQQILRHGRRLCGPELVGTIDFNQKLTRRKWLMEYLKHGNYVVPLQVPYINLKNHHEKFIERRIDPQDSSSLYAATSTESPSSSPQGMEVHPQHEGQKLYFE
jgi:hypothetical protein